MATINDFKREISELVKAQKVAKRINHQSEVYRNRGLLHAMYVAYYILKHKLVGDAQEAYYKQVLDSWKKLKFNGWYGCVQGGHAVAQWLLEHPNQNWNNNYLIYLYADLDKWRVRLDLTNKDYSIFREPDLNNQLTAIALQDDGRMFKKLKLVGNY